MPKNLPGLWHHLIGWDQIHSYLAITVWLSPVINLIALSGILFLFEEVLESLTLKGSLTTQLNVTQWVQNVALNSLTSWRTSTSSTRGRTFPFLSTRAPPSFEVLPPTSRRRANDDVKWTVPSSTCRQADCSGPASSGNVASTRRRRTNQQNTSTLVVSLRRPPPVCLRVFGNGNCSFGSLALGDLAMELRSATSLAWSYLRACGGGGSISCVMRASFWWFTCNLQRCDAF